MNSIVYNTDCMQGMKQYPDKYFDLAVVDPPYGIGAGSKSFKNRSSANKRAEKFYKDNDWDKCTPEDEYWQELMRVSKNWIVWGGNYFPLPLTKSWIFWDKNVPKGISFADGELAWTSFDIVLRKVNIPHSGFVNSDTNRMHPTQKLVALS